MKIVFMLIKNSEKRENYFKKKCYECWTPTKAQLIFHELIPQIPLFCNYENCIHAYLKSRKTKYYFENQGKFVKVLT